MSAGDESEIIEAAKAWFLADTSRTDPVSWPNKTEVVDVPRYEFRQGPTANRTKTFGGLSEVNLTVIITAVTAANTATTTSNAMVSVIRDRFAINTYLGDTNARVSKRPVTGAGYTDEAQYRVPVTITIRALLQG